MHYMAGYHQTTATYRILSVFVTCTCVKIYIVEYVIKMACKYFVGKCFVNIWINGNYPLVAFFYSCVRKKKKQVDLYNYTATVITSEDTLVR